MTARTESDLLDAFAEILERDGGLTESDQAEIARIEVEMEQLEAK